MPEDSAANGSATADVATQSPADAPGDITEEAAGDVPDGKQPAADGPTDARRITALQQLIRDDQQRRARLEDELDDIAGSFDDVSDKFAQLTEQVDQKKQQLAEAGLAADEKARLQTELKTLEVKRKRAEEDLNLTIARRKALQAQVATLDEKLRLEKAGLDRLLGKQVDEPTANGTNPPIPPASAENGASGSPQALPGSAAAPAAFATDLPPAAARPGEESPADEIDEVATFDSKVATAEAEFQAKLATLRRAEEQANRLREGVVVFEQDLANEEALLDTARRQQAAAAARRKQLESELAALDADDANQAAARQAKQAALAAAEESFAQATAAVEEHAGRIESLGEQLAGLRGEQERVAEQLDTLQDAAEQAGSRLRWVKSPLAPHRVSQWLLERAPKILALLAILFGFWWLMRFVGRRAIRGLARRSRSGTAEEREERAQTLISVLNSVATISVLVIGLLAVLDQAGVDVTVLMGGAAALGVAVGFGAQNLMRDYFYGTMILAENQYRVGNWVTIAGITGMVENITLRITVLRDLEGIVHFIPHSQITTVSNLTHGWSRAVLNIGVAYKEDINRVMEILMELAGEMRGDEVYGDLILEDPEMLGVDAFEDSAVVIKFMLKTRPLKQWKVRRELLRRIKNRFDELGIEIPFPHRTIYHRDLGVMSAIENESNID